MFLSCLMIDVGTNPDRPRPGRLWLRNLYRVHQRLSMAFPSRATKVADPLFLHPYSPAAFCHVGAERTAEQAFLFRVDHQPGGSSVILVQSAVEPDWDYAFQNSPFLAAPPEVKAFEPRFEPGTVLRFRLLANPTKKIGTITKEERERLSPDEFRQRKGRNGARVPVPDGELERWLTDRSGRSGFRIERLDAIVPGYVLAVKDEAAGGRLRCARYDGVLAVENAESFERSIIQGIGPAKAFGCGLLSVARNR